MSALIHICKFIFYIFRNTTPKKKFSSEFLNTIISPFKEYSKMPNIGTPYNQNNFNISSPYNNQIRFNSPMNSKLNKS